MGFFDFFKRVPRALDRATEIPAIKQVFPVVAQVDAVKDSVKAMAADFPGSLVDELRRWPETRLNAWMVRLGHAFGPPGLKHFSELSPLAQKSLLERVPVLKTAHSDWPAPFDWVPRRLTCWVGPAPTVDDVIEGNVTELKPIPNNGEWYVMRGYMAATTEDGIHDRLGWRFDDVDGYWNLAFFTVKKVN